MENKLIFGIDTSKWQASKVDYYTAACNDVKFVFLRIGYNKTLDPCFEADYAAAVRAGLKVGVYFYTLAKTVEEAVYDATRVLGWLNNRHLDFPIAYDVEDSKQKNKNRTTINAEMYNAFAKKIESYGIYDAILYTGEYFYNTYFNKNLIKDDLWIAKYNSTAPNVGRDVSIWQFSSDPIDTAYYKGKLDVNYMLKDQFQGSKEALTFVALNPYPVPTRTLKYVPLVRIKGNDVRWLQYELYEKNYMLITEIDGDFGKKTEACLKQYQKDHKLVVDGKAGPATRYSMLND